MSKNLVLEALELCEEDDFSQLRRDGKRRSKRGSKRGQLNSGSRIEKHSKSKDQSNLEKNLLMLKKLSQASARSFDIVENTKRGKNKSQKQQQQEPPQQATSNNNETVFTEQDFKEFEKEYFNKN